METSNLLWAVLMEEFDEIEIEDRLKIEIYFKAKDHLKSCLQQLKPNKEKLVVNGEADVVFLYIISGEFNEENKAEIHENIAIIDEYGKIRWKHGENQAIYNLMKKGKFITEIPSEPEIMGTLKFSISQNNEGFSSKKAKNLLLNWKCFIVIIADIVRFFNINDDIPFTKITTSFKILDTIIKKTKIMITQDEYISMEAMWLNHDSKNQIPEEEALNLTNKSRTSTYNLPEITKDMFGKIINSLSNKKSLTISDGIIQLEEEIKI